MFIQGIVDVLCEACQQLKWKLPTKIQKEAIPVALEGIIKFIMFALHLFVWDILM